MQKKKRLFISHSSKDNAIADSIVQWLKTYGFEDIWYDRRNPGAGHLRKNIGDALDTMQVFIVLLSPDAVKSDWVIGEIGMAQALERAGAQLDIIPIIVRPCGIPFMLDNYKHVDLTSCTDPVVELAQLARLIEGSVSASPISALPPFASSTQASQEPRRRVSRIGIHMGDVHANEVNIHEAKEIKITKNYGAKPVSEAPTDN